MHEGHCKPGKGEIKDPKATAYHVTPVRVEEDSSEVPPNPRAEEEDDSRDAELKTNRPEWSERRADDIHREYGGAPDGACEETSGGSLKGGDRMVSHRWLVLRVR